MFNVAFGVLQFVVVRLVLAFVVLATELKGVYKEVRGYRPCLASFGLRPYFATLFRAHIP